MPSTKDAALFLGALTGGALFGALVLGALKGLQLEDRGAPLPDPPDQVRVVEWRDERSLVIEYDLPNGPRMTDTVQFTQPVTDLRSAPTWKPGSTVHVNFKRKPGATAKRDDTGRLEASIGDQK